MKTSLRTSLSEKKTLIALSVICVIVAAACGLLSGLGEFLLPAVIATLAALFVFDKKRTVTMITSGIIISLNIAMLIASYFLGFGFTFFGLAAVISALIIASAYSRGDNKSDSAFLATIIYALLGAASMIIFAMIQNKSFAIDAAIGFWTDFFESLYQGTIDATNSMIGIFSEYYDESEIAYIREMINLWTDIYFCSMISYFVIGGFAVIGISMKIFGFIIKKCSDDTTKITAWRFGTSNVFAYFYLAVSIAAIFVSSVDNIFGITVVNLYAIFMVIYAYVGFKSSVALLSKKLHPALSYLIVIVASLVLITVSPQILATIGVIFTFNENRGLANPNG